MFSEMLILLLEISQAVSSSEPVLLFSSFLPWLWHIDYDHTALISLFFFSIQVIFFLGFLKRTELLEFFPAFFPSCCWRVLNFCLLAFFVCLFKLRTVLIQDCYLVRRALEKFSSFLYCCIGLPLIPPLYAWESEFFFFWVCTSVKSF